MLVSSFFTFAAHVLRTYASFILSSILLQINPRTPLIFVVFATAVFPLQMA
jgi:hypothetical protein